MNCQKCGSNLISGDSFCRKCGASINTLNQNINMNSNVNQTTNINQTMNTSQQVNSPNQGVYNNTTVNNTEPLYNQQANYTQTYSGQPNYNNQPNYNQPVYGSQDIDEDLKRAYVGEKYDEFKRGIGATPVLIFFLRTCYTLYRKMYLLSILWMVGSVILNVFLPYIGGLVSFGATIFLMIKFRDLYLKHVDSEVKKIKDNNPGASRDELIRICSKKGGTNLAVAIIVPFITFVLTIALISVPIILGVMNTAKEDASESAVLEYINDVERQLASNSNNDPFYEYPMYANDPEEFSSKSDEPDSMFLFIDDETGKVESGTLIYDDVTYTYYDGEVSISEY